MNGQVELFAEPTQLAIDRSFTAARRTALDEHSWVEAAPRWLSGAEELFTTLLTAVPWKQHYRRLFDQNFLEPRLTAQCGDLRSAPHPALADAAAALSEHYGVTYDNLWLNLYRDERDSTGWHRDRFSCRRPECIVPVLTLGAARKFLLKPRRGGPSKTFNPRSGDLIVMGGRCQEDWLHAVPKSAQPSAPRISINFQSSMQARRSR